MTPLQNLIYFNPEMCGGALEIMMKEFSRINFENRLIPGKDMSWIRENLNAWKLFDECMNELQEMANTEFWASRSFYSLLKMTRSIRKLSNLAENVVFIRKVEDTINSKFSFFQHELTSKLKESLD